MVRVTIESRLHHLALAVSNLEKSIRFYQQCMGFEVVENYSWGIEGNFLDQMMGSNFGSGRAAMLSSGNAFIEIFEYDDLPGVFRLENPLHFCIYTDNIVDLFQKVSEYGANVLHPPLNTQLGTSLAFIKDPDGNLIELLQIHNESDVLNFGVNDKYS